MNPQYAKVLFSSTKTQTIEIEASIQLMESFTGLIICSDEAKGFAETISKTTLAIGGTAGYDATISDKAIPAALGQLVDSIINKCIDKPLKAFRDFFGEDAVFFSKSTRGQEPVLYRDGNPLLYQVFVYRRDIVRPQRNLYLDLQVDSGANSVLVQFISLAASAINTSLADHIVAAREANFFIFRDIPRGKYSPDYLKGQDVAAEPKDVSAHVR